MEDLYPFIRAFHILGAAMWLGESILVNFVLYPALRRNPNEAKRAFVLAIYRRVFNLTTMSAVITLLTGILLLISSTDGDLYKLSSSDVGRSLIAASLIGILLIPLHIMEKRSIIRMKKAHETASFVPEQFLPRLKWTSIITAIALVTAFLIMLNSVSPML